MGWIELDLFVYFEGGPKWICLYGPGLIQVWVRPFYIFKFVNPNTPDSWPMGSTNSKVQL